MQYRKYLSSVADSTIVKPDEGISKGAYYNQHYYNNIGNSPNNTTN